MTFNLTLSHVQQRALAVLLSLLPVLLLATSLVSCVSQMGQHHQRVAIVKHQISEYRALIEAAPKWKHEVARLDAADGGAAALFNGPYQMAATNLEGRLTTLVANDGGKITQSGVELRSFEGAGPVHLEAIFGVDANTETLARILYDLQNQKPLMFADQIFVRDDTSAPGVPVSSAPHTLHVRLNIVAFVWLAR